MKIIFDAIDGQPVSTPARRHRAGLRNWQKFMLCYSLIMAGGALILVDLGGLQTAATGLLIWLATAGVILAIAGMKGRL